MLSRQILKTKRHACFALAPRIQPTPFLQGVVLARQPQAPQKAGLKAGCWKNRGEGLKVAQGLGACRVREFRV